MARIGSAQRFRVARGFAGARRSSWRFCSRCVRIFSRLRSSRRRTRRHQQAFAPRIVRRQTEQALRRPAATPASSWMRSGTARFSCSTTKAASRAGTKGRGLLTGYTADEILGRHFAKPCIPPDAEESAGKLSSRSQPAKGGSRKVLASDARMARYCGDDIIARRSRRSRRAAGIFPVVIRRIRAAHGICQPTEQTAPRDFYFALFSGLPRIWSGAPMPPGPATISIRPGSTTPAGRRGRNWVAAGSRASPGRSEALGRDFRTRRGGARGLRAGAAIAARQRRVWLLIWSGRPYAQHEGVFLRLLCTCYDNTGRRAVGGCAPGGAGRYGASRRTSPGCVQLERDVDSQLKFLREPGAAGTDRIAGSGGLADAEAFLSRIAAADRAHLLAHAQGFGTAAHQLELERATLPDARESPRSGSRSAPARTHRPSPATVLDGVVFDDTQARLAQLEIERSREELRALSRHLQSVREEEKARIAREVHDELGSTSTALKMDLDWLGEHLHGAPDAALEKRTAMGKLVDAAVAATRGS